MVRPWVMICAALGALYSSRLILFLVLRILFLTIHLPVCTVLGTWEKVQFIPDSFDGQVASTSTRRRSRSTSWCRRRRRWWSCTTAASAARCAATSSRRCASSASRTRPTTTSSSRAPASQSPSPSRREDLIQYIHLYNSMNQ